MSDISSHRRNDGDESDESDGSDGSYFSDSDNLVDESQTIYMQRQTNLWKLMKKERRAYKKSGHGYTNGKQVMFRDWECKKMDAKVELGIHSKTEADSKLKHILAQNELFPQKKDPY